MTDIGYVNGLMEQVENCRTEETIMPMSCKCILDRMVFKGAMTEKEREKIMRKIKEYKPSVIVLNEERKTGKWVVNRDAFGNRNVDCSVCGKGFFTASGIREKDDSKILEMFLRENVKPHGIRYCLFCGAKMEVDE